MMVEDDPDDRRIYGTILCYNGFDVVLASDTQRAIAQLEKFPPDLVLLDLGLPDGNGLEVCRALAATSRRVPVLALSGFSENTMGERARDAGCAEYIEKPTNPLHVLHRIESILGRPPAAGEGPEPRLIDLD